MKKSVVAVATKSSSALLFLRGKGKSLPAALSVLPQSICNTQGSYSNRIHGVRSVLKASGWQRALYTSCTGSVCWHSTSHPGSDDALPQEWAKFSAYMRHDGFSELCEKMYTEMVQLEENEESLIPLKVRGFEYTLLPEDGYQSVYRVPQNSSMVEPERIIYTKDLLEHLHGDRVDIEALKISYSGDQIMLLVRTDDGDSHVFIRDMKDKRTVIQSHIRNAMNVEFDRDGRVYFTVPGRTGVPSSVMVADAIQSSTNEASAELPRCVFNDDDPKNFVGLQRTKDWEYLCINSNSKISSEVYIIDGIHDDVVCIQERMPGIEYAVEHCQGHLILLSNHGDGLDPHIYTAKVDRAVSGRISVGEWHKAYSPQAGSFIIDMTVHQHGITVIEKSFPAIPSVKVLPIETTFSDVLALNSPYTLPLPEWVMDVQFGCNEEYQSPCVELELQSPIIPSIHVEWNLLSKQINEVSRHRDEYFTRDLEHKLGHYSATRVPLKFKDGLSIPLTLVYRNDVTNPSKCLFIAYGAYGDTLDMSHQTFLFPLLDRGWKVFFVHCRGGGEMGKAWYQSGRVPNKKCTEIDLRACIKTMIDNGVAHPDGIALMTNSAGAIPICGVMNSSPGLVQAVVLDSPFVDVFRSMLDQSHALTEHEYDEFGNPQNEDQAHLVAEICPTMGLKQQPYPSVLTSVGNMDHHVPVGGTVRYIQLLRKNNTNEKANILLWQAYRHHLPEADEILDVRAVQLAFLESETKKPDV